MRTKLEKMYILKVYTVKIKSYLILKKKKEKLNSDLIKQINQ